MKYIVVNLHFRQLVHRPETSTLNVPKTTFPHKSNKIVNIVSKNSLKKVKGIFSECVSFKRRHRLQTMKSYDKFYFYKFMARNNISPEKKQKQKQRI